MGLRGEPVQDALPPCRGGNRLRDVSVGGRSIGDAWQSGFHRPTAEPGRQQVGRAVERHVGCRFVAGRIADHHLRIAGAGDQRDVGQAERAGADVLRENPGVVDVEVHRRGHQRGAAQIGQRHGDEIRPQREIPLHLQAADPDRPGPGQPAVDGVARDPGDHPVGIGITIEAVQPDQPALAIVVDTDNGGL